VHGTSIYNKSFTFDGVSDFTDTEICFFVSGWKAKLHIFIIGSLKIVIDICKKWVSQCEETVKKCV